MTKFAVVEFVDEKAVDVVPETWIEKRDGVYYSYYPRSNVATRVRRKEMPDKECWASYEIRLLSKADLYEKAIKKAKKAEETSNVDSSDSDCGRGKRNRKSNDYNESEDDGECEEDDYIVLPRKKSNTTKHFRDVENINPRKPPSKKARTSSCGTISLPKPPQFYEKSASSQAAKSTPRPHIQLTSQPISHYEVVELPKTKEYGSAELVGDSLRLLDDGCGDIPDISNENVTEPFLHSLESNAPFSDLIQDLGTASKLGNSSSLGSNHQNRNSQMFQNRVLMKLESILENQKETLTYLRQQRSFSGNPGAEEIVEEIIPKPFETAEEMEELNKKCEQSTFNAALVRYLTSQCGHSCGDTVRRIMGKLGSNKLWSLFSLKGRKGKKAFKSLQIYNVITKACTKCYPKITELKIEENIADTLKHAPGKPGGSRYQNSS